MPTKRTFLKTGRDLFLVAGAAVVTYLTDHQADLGIPVELVPAYVAVLGFAWRWVRQAMGDEPVEAAKP